MSSLGGMRIEGTEGGPVWASSSMRAAGQGARTVGDQGLRISPVHAGRVRNGLPVHWFRLDAARRPQLAPMSFSSVLASYARPPLAPVSRLPGTAEVQTGGTYLQLLNRVILFC